MAVTYTLSREMWGERPDQRDARWVIRCRPATVPAPDGDGEALQLVDATTMRHAPTAYAAQAWATRALYAHKTRVIDWYPVPDTDDVFQAHTAPWCGGWQVAVYRGCSAALWRAADAGGWTGRLPSDPAGSRLVRDLATLERLDGPLRIVEVWGVPALIAELEVYRAVAGYTTGREECLERECDHYLDGDGHPVDTAERPAGDCPHIEQEIATRDEAFALHRAQRALDALAAESQAPPDDQLDKSRQGELDRMEGIRHAVEYVTEAIEREDDE